MSGERSNGTNSILSSATIPKRRPSEPLMDPSNILYNDRQNYQTIFTNDSRFFDTSLHLFQSYTDLGYVPSNQKKSKKTLPPLPSNGYQSQPNVFGSRWRPKPAGFSSNYDAKGSTNGTLKPPFVRRHDHSISHRSDPGTSKLITSRMNREKSPLPIPFDRQSVPSSNYYPSPNDDDSDDPDIIVTRL